jgi:hypothetical protein
MNAYELADSLITIESGWPTDLTLQESATMLRLQADRIAELEKQLNFVENASVNSLVISKQLSDDDIEAIAENLDYDTYEHLKNAFSRAIIREINK